VVFFKFAFHELTSPLIIQFTSCDQCSGRPPVIGLPYTYLQK